MLCFLQYEKLQNEASKLDQVDKRVMKMGEEAVRDYLRNKPNFTCESHISKRAFTLLIRVPDKIKIIVSFLQIASNLSFVLNIQARFHPAQACLRSLACIAAFAVAANVPELHASVQLPQSRLHSLVERLLRLASHLLRQTVRCVQSAMHSDTYFCCRIAVMVVPPVSC